MEGFPKSEALSNKQEGSIESLNDWRNLKESAPQQAQELMGEIIGFETMEATEQISALQNLLESLSSDNHNRFVAEAIAVQLSIITENEKFSKRMAQLKMAA